MRKTVKINDYDFDALIDTSSTITLICESVYQILGRPTLNATKIKLTSFGKIEIKLFGSFKSTINIEDNKFMTDIYVIDNSQTTIDVIIGTDVLKQTEFKISAIGIELIPKKKDPFINLINVSKAHNQSELKDNALEVLQLKLKNAEDKCKNLEMHVRNRSTLSLEKTAFLDKLHKLEESNLEKVDKLVKLEEKYEILQETLKITEKRLVEKEIQNRQTPDKYEVEKVGQHEGPHLTSTAVDFMKRFAYNILDFFRCGQLTFRMADCEVEGATRYCKPPSIPLPSGFESKREGNDSDGKRQREKGPENQRRRIDRKGSRRIWTEPLYFFKNNESQLDNDV
ncbi:uncharacterized protein TNCV_3478871 [Trichonephila clavipes]|nr:uncharacterized protein TNCV_3478871 [Trichonephila clavipes]